LSNNSGHGNGDGTGTRPRAAIFGCAGLQLSEDERAFFAETRPYGFILFARNIETPAQVRDLVTELRASVGRADAPVLIDQEGGRVQRLGPPHWRAIPPARRFGALFAQDQRAGEEAVEVNARLIAAELMELGINVDCLPVLDVPVRGAHDIIGDRAFAEDPGVVARLGAAVCRALRNGGVMPIIKHIPGHGRARSDSHLELPVVDAPLSDLRKWDFAPFHAVSQALNGGAQCWAMTAHVVYKSLDDKRPATISPVVIDTIIRGEIGFDGPLISDDLSMKALRGGMRERTEASLAAGCDLVLHCNGKMNEMREIAAVCPALSDTADARLAKASAGVPRHPAADQEALRRRLESLLSAATVAARS
jgi:beta-N-acetylhexosaminidase